MTRVDFILRSDANEKGGGDNLQIEEYEKHLIECGFDVRKVPFRLGMTMREGSIVHIVNVDRPFDFLEAYRLSARHRVVVSPIHHSLADVRAMRRAESGRGLRATVGRILPESGRELLAFMLRTLRRVQSPAQLLEWSLACLRAFARASGVWRRVGRALDESSCVALLAKGEGEALMRDTAWSGRNAVLIPNGLPDPALPMRALASKPWAERKNEICVIGRIEPRKRQLEVARAATKLGASVVFVGAPSVTASEYVRSFESLIAVAPGLSWLGPLPHNSALEVMSESKVLLNASWVEVQSLVDLESASMGCQVVVGRGGNSKEWLSGSVVEIDTHDVEKLVSTARRIAGADEAPAPIRYDHTWKSASQALSDVYLSY